MAKRKIDGVLLLDKPFGISSNNALQKARWLLSAEKAGHTGVLDPFATGLLPLCFGEATKFAQRMLDADKGYRAMVRLGQVSSTLDGEGVITDSGMAPADLAPVEAVLARFRGEIEQVPPMHSALKFEGKALYEYARQGVEIERAVRRVTIYALDVLGYDAASGVLTLDVRCSKGTYIRTLADDIGRELGCGAYLTGLVRTRTAGFSLDDAIGLDAFGQLDLPQREALLLPAETLVLDLPELRCDDADTHRMLHGMTARRPDVAPGTFRLYGSEQSTDNARFLGLGEVGADGVLRSKRLLSTA
ncbi:tRNA pseudouridine(55) synthase TruB [Chitiniphilus eburneus]|uniref:tRNA pseudouridine synthase B n=1 Tax=Chitiniphilus eburneus TaxID=2571148 RepID=A0A4U0PXI8_9NEIS|nr:tRNA pseudouridine(55) synthase TruB [Chitiniphilus eburneus]TJZ73275.1 tRNA pseudouridine(55) synthase TruB [Chitiniphilus eburneus]